MSTEESHIYSAIISEQIALQEMQEESAAIGEKGGDEGRSLSMARRIKQQRAILARLWEEAEARSRR